MTNKLKNQVFENITKTRVVLRLHPRLLLELEAFRSRNSAPSTISAYCIRCLKAHLIKKAREFHMEEEIENIHHELEDEVGHEGYYLDADRIIKID